MLCLRLWEWSNDTLRLIGNHKIDVESRQKPAVQIAVQIPTPILLNGRDCDKIIIYIFSKKYEANDILRDSVVD